MKRPRIVYWNNIPSPYVVGRFNAIATRGNLDFSAIFDEERESDRTWDVNPEAWQFSGSYVERIPFLTARSPVWGETSPPDLLVSLYRVFGERTGEVCEAHCRSSGLRGKGGDDVEYAHCVFGHRPAFLSPGKETFKRRGKRNVFATKYSKSTAYCS